MGLLSSIRDDGLSYMPTMLSMCPNINQPVFSLFYAASEFNTEIPTINAGECKLYVTCDVISGGKRTVQELFEILWQWHGDAICHGNFSCVNKVFTTFTNEDVSFIGAAKLLELDEDSLQERITNKHRWI